MTKGKRVLISGMGSELGSLVATLLEQEPAVGEMVGLDIDPPRRRLRRARFHRVDPSDRRKIVGIVRNVDPEVVIHLGVWEPDARANPRDAAQWTASAAIGVLGAAATCPSLEHLVVRSGVSIYGRRRGSATRPDESVTPDPMTPFGRTLLQMEQVAERTQRTADVPMTVLRLAPVVGPHVPSPLGRLLRLPAVPVSALADPAFALVDDQDAAAAIVAAAGRRYDGVVNVASPGAVTAIKAARMGGRIPVPLLGPEWAVARFVTGVFGAPIPPHVLELMHRGGTVDAGHAGDAIGVMPSHSTPEVVQALYEWATVVHLRPSEAVA
jgi:UDP-glucose 4-epimerase